MKNIQIPERLFYDLISYTADHLDTEDARYERIRTGILAKLEAMRRHDIYTQSKTADSEEEREAARQAYLDRIGVPKAFR